MCIACGELFPGKSLFRMVMTKEGKIIPDENYALSGKGVYICRKKECVNQLLQGRKFRRKYHKLMDDKTLERLKTLL